MFTAPDFSKKQIVFVLFNEGEKLAFSNDNLVVKDSFGKVKFQCTCYRLFIIFAVGHTSITSALIQKAQKFGFYIALMDIGIAKIIVSNKMSNQLSELKSVRNKNDFVKESIKQISEYIKKIPTTSNINELMAYEGLASKIYFKSHFNNVLWQGRQPRIKRDYVNSTLDIGYTLLFTFIDALLSSYGFDNYCGIMHTQFYMRKSLVCDIVEPFRVLIDHEVKKAINLKQIKEEDFIIINHQYRLKWDKSADYVKILMKPLLDNKEGIFAYIQSYYRAFMKELPPEKFPVFEIGD